MSDAAANAPVSLGLGLLSIGRTWGYRPGSPPAEEDALALLDHAVSHGITFFDTAPAYGASERILGRFLRRHAAKARDVTISTKMGEHWNAQEQGAFTDHSYATLCRSLDRSLDLLGRIDLLQIHKATSTVLALKDVERAVDYARSMGIKAIGASVSDLDAAHIACTSGIYTSIQFPYNQLSPALAPVFGMARNPGVSVLINRPFGMGRIVPNKPDDKAHALIEALSFILEQPFNGVILTGTKLPHHLDESIAAFRAAMQARAPA
jgi:aryl-alcohol dehydrogenase-like predicted oxidoreductase